ncbi:mitochondrial fission process protein 1 [Drosophila eugracilis]|uniref:mitochondrial fission process protein 1 n=1 Tax=Drosophila eugracilis TaxID=29029 RepID=UPI0007E88297|nr:mitochondrial fission process protein 1 [Drosophila eugracilis]
MSEDKQNVLKGTEAQETAHKVIEKDLDIYRDTFIRYMGYSNEIGESFRPLVPKSLVAATYGMAIGYVCTDTFDKSLRLQMNGASSREVAIKGGDVFCWQMLASVAIPGLVINRITWATKSLLTRAPSPILKTVPTLVGLASIPLIIHPIDSLVDRLMDVTYRKMIR